MIEHPTDHQQTQQKVAGPGLTQQPGQEQLQLPDDEKLEDKVQHPQQNPTEIGKESKPSGSSFPQQIQQFQTGYIPESDYEQKEPMSPKLKQKQMQMLKSTANELHREEVRLEEMFHDSLSIIFEFEWLQKYVESPHFSELSNGCVKRYQLTEKMIMNHLQDEETYTPHGALLRERFHQKVLEILNKSEEYFQCEDTKQILIQFTNAVKSGVNLWDGKKVIESVKPLDEARANYVMSLLNKGLIRTDSKAEHFYKTGKAMVDTVDQLFQEAKQKVAYEMHNATNGKKTKARKFMDNFYSHDPNNFC